MRDRGVRRSMYCTNAPYQLRNLATTMCIHAQLGLDGSALRTCGCERGFSRSRRASTIRPADLDGRASIDWGVYGVPETFIVDKQGVIRFKQIGPLTQDSMKRFLPQIEAAKVELVR